jgi:cell shape-determining protein MreC
MTIETKDLAKAEIEFLSDKCEKLEQENQQLKKLLKECRDDIYNYQYICLGTLTKIDNAIGEK